MEQFNEAVNAMIQEAILQHKREGYKKNFYSYRERNLEKAKTYAREYARKRALQKKLEKEANEANGAETLGTIFLQN